MGRYPIQTPIRAKANLSGAGTTYSPTFESTDFDWAADFERRAIGSRRIAGEGPICAHNFVTDAVRRNPALDNNVVQAEGMAACIAAQLAALAEEKK